MRNGKEVTCEHCNHFWFTNSKRLKVTCTNCGLKTRNEFIAGSNNVSEKEEE
jgi:transcription elongation factor Elf1